MVNNSSDGVCVRSSTRKHCNTDCDDGSSKERGGAHEKLKEGVQENAAKLIIATAQARRMTAVQMKY